MMTKTFTNPQQRISDFIIRHIVWMYCSLLLPCFTNAQSLYNLTVSSGTYSSFAPVGALTYENSSAGYYHALQLEFRIFNRTADFREHINVPSRGAYLSAGYMAVYESPEFKNTYVLQPASSNNVFLKPGFSSVHAKVEGNTPKRILKYEFRNLYYQNDTNQKLSYQIWLHEEDTSISYHFGPNSISGPAPLSCGIFLYNQNFTSTLDFVNVFGNPLAPSLSSDVNNPGASLSDIPPDGTIYTFKRSNKLGLKSLAIQTLDIYPNPCSDILSVPSAVSADAVEIYDVTGKLALAVKGGQAEISVAGLTPGIYQVKVLSNGSISSARMIKS